MHDGHRDIQTSDLPAVEHVHELLAQADHADPLLRGMVSGMVDQLLVDPDSPLVVEQRLEVDEDEGDVLFFRFRRLLLELLLLVPLRVLTAYVRTRWHWPSPPSSDYNSASALGADLQPDGRDPFRSLSHFRRDFGLQTSDNFLGPVAAGSYVDGPVGPVPQAQTTTQADVPAERVLLASDASDIGDGANITFGDFPARATLGVENTFHVPFSADRTGIPHARVGDDNPLAAFLRTNGIAELQRIMQEVVMQPDFVVPAAGTAAQLRVAREWELPSAEDCPALHEFLPDGYGGEEPRGL